MIRVEIRTPENFDVLGLWIMREDPHTHERFVAKPIVLDWEKPEYWPQFPEPTLMFQHGDESTQFLTGLTQALARNGFVPDEVEEHRSALAATKEHLKDMKEIAFHALGIGR